MWMSLLFFFTFASCEWFSLSLECKMSIQNMLAHVCVIAFVIATVYYVYVDVCVCTFEMVAVLFVSIYGCVCRTKQWTLNASQVCRNECNSVNERQSEVDCINQQWIQSVSTTSAHINTSFLRGSLKSVFIHHLRSAHTHTIDSILIFKPMI